MPFLQKGVAMLSGRMPKVINPTAHAIIDYAVAITFFAMGALFWSRNRHAALSSLVCGVATTANSVLTDYPGGVYRVLSYEEHGKIDLALAGVTASMPGMMGFEEEPEARFFRAQAVAETVVTAMTDFKALDRTFSNHQYRHTA